MPKSNWNFYRCLLFKFLSEAEGLAFSIPATLSAQLLYINGLVSQRRHNCVSVIIQVQQMNKEHDNSLRTGTEFKPAS